MGLRRQRLAGLSCRSTQKIFPPKDVNYMFLSTAKNLQKQI